MIAIDEHIDKRLLALDLPLELNIIIVTYNSARAIGTCLSSIAADLHPCILVVDNCSTDGTVAIVNEFGIHCLTTARNVGYGQAANIGAKAASARYIGFLNPDCQPDRTYFHRGVETLHDNPGNCAVPRRVGRKTEKPAANSRDIAE
jgi:O-antigen biosynthesis protein